MQLAGRNLCTSIIESNLNVASDERILDLQGALKLIVITIEFLANFGGHAFATPP